MPEKKNKRTYSCDGKLMHSVKTREEFDPILDDIGKGKNITKHKHRIGKH